MSFLNLLLISLLKFYSPIQQLYSFFHIKYMSISIFPPQILTNALKDLQSTETKKIIAILCQSILTKNTNISQIENSLKFIFKICCIQNSPSLLNFILFRISWFQNPYIRLLPILQKTIRLYRGQGKQAIRASYNILAEGLVTTNENGLIIQTICKLMEGRYDNQILLTTLKQNYPHKNRNVEAHQNYIRGLLLLSQKRENVRYAILQIIIEQLSTIDTEIKTGDAQLTLPYIKEKQFLLKKQVQEQIGGKLDRLLNIMLEYLEKDKIEIAKQLLTIFNEMVLIMQKNKYIQYIIFYISQRNKKVSGYFLSLLSNNILEQSTQISYKQAYLNNIFYLASYIIRSSKCSQKKISSCLIDIISYLKNKLTPKSTIQDISSVYLNTIFKQNQNLLYLIQMIIYISTYRPAIYSTLEIQINQILNLADKKVRYQFFMNKQILKKFKQGKKQQIKIDNQHEIQYLLFQNKFNPILLKKLSQKIDPLYLFYETNSQEQQCPNRKRKASVVLEKTCMKKIKKDQKDSQHSEQSTNFLKF